MCGHRAAQCGGLGQCCHMCGCIGQRSVAAWGSAVWRLGAAQCVGIGQHSVVARGSAATCVAAWGSAVWLGQHSVAWGSTVWHVAAQCGSMGQHSVAWGSTVWRHGAAQCGTGQQMGHVHHGTEAKQRAPEQGMYLCMAWVGACTRVTQMVDKEHQSRACACLGMGCGMYTGHTEARQGATEQDMTLYTELCSLHSSSAFCTAPCTCNVVLTSSAFLMRQSPLRIN